MTDGYDPRWAKWGYFEAVYLHATAYWKEVRLEIRQRWARELLLERERVLRAEKIGRLVDVCWCD